MHLNTFILLYQMYDLLDIAKRYFCYLEGRGTTLFVAICLTHGALNTPWMSFLSYNFPTNKFLIIHSQERVCESEREKRERERKLKEKQ